MLSSGWRLGLVVQSQSAPLNQRARSPAAAVMSTAVAALLPSVESLMSTEGGGPSPCSEADSPRLPWLHSMTA